MKVKSSILVMLVGALLVPAFAFAADAPAAKAAPVSLTPAAPTASMLQMSPAASACSDASLLPTLPMLPLSTDLGGVCGPCSATSCVGRPELGGCAAGRCIPQGTCSATQTAKCNCLPL
ncbi:MAG TPA: hypothetical protein VKY89_14625 [Thermoanaerobaculia bacterium]|nr:hypothetical protein [Thermoanaerobaculia bacterium]